MKNKTKLFWVPVFSADDPRVDVCGEKYQIVDGIPRVWYPEYEDDNFLGWVGFRSAEEAERALHGCAW